MNTVIGKILALIDDTKGASHIDVSQTASRSKRAINHEWMFLSEIKIEVATTPSFNEDKFEIACFDVLSKLASVITCRRYNGNGSVYYVFSIVETKKEG